MIDKKLRDIHTYPVNDLVEHDLTRTCWCDPALYALCDECEDEDEFCWKCDGDGATETTADDATTMLMIVHNVLDGRE